MRPVPGSVASSRDAHWAFGENRYLGTPLPESFASRAALVGAELARIEGREQLDAVWLYERAISSARAADLIHKEALANEQAGRFYLARGFERVANAHIWEARDCYLRWPQLISG